jgi:hypothetical protein
MENKRQEARLCESLVSAGWSERLDALTWILWAALAATRPRSAFEVPFCNVFAAYLSLSTTCSSNMGPA